MGRHSRRSPRFRQRLTQISHGLSRIAIEHVAYRECEYHAVIVTAAKRLVEKEVSGFFKSGDSAELVDASFDVGMPCLPIVSLHPIRLQHWIRQEQTGRFHVDDESRVAMHC